MRRYTAPPNTLVVIIRAATEFNLGSVEEGEVNWGCAVVLLELGAFLFKSNVQWIIHPHADAE